MTGDMAMAIEECLHFTRGDSQIQNLQALLQTWGVLGVLRSTRDKDMIRSKMGWEKSCRDLLKTILYFV